MRDREREREEERGRRGQADQMSAPEDENALDRQQRLIYKYMPCKAGVWGWGRVNLKSEMRNLNKSE